MKIKSKCEKIKEIEVKIENLENLSDSISTSEFNKKLNEFKKELIQILLSKESCKENNQFKISNIYNIIGNLKDRVN